MERKEPARLDWRGEGQNPLATFRSSWTDPNALFLAVKAGTPAASHAHLDIGSFILDAMGERWSLDLGMQEYNNLEQRGFDLWGNKQGAQRWSLFRYHNQGHSTLVVNGAEQVISSRAPISAAKRSARAAQKSCGRTGSRRSRKRARVSITTALNLYDSGQFR